MPTDLTLKCVHPAHTVYLFIPYDYYSTHCIRRSVFLMIAQLVLCEVGLKYGNFPTFINI